MFLFAHVKKKQVQIYTATHPVEAHERIKGPELAKPIKVFISYLFLESDNHSNFHNVDR